MKRRKVLAAALSAAALTVTSLAVAPPAQAAGFVILEQLGSGQCAQPSRTNPLGEGVTVQMYRCDSTLDVQRWSVVEIGSVVRLVNKASGYCLRANPDIAFVRTHACTNISDNNWAKPVVSTIPRHVISKVSGGTRCLNTIARNLPRPGERTKIGTCDANDPFHFWIVRAG